MGEGVSISVPETTATLPPAVDPRLAAAVVEKEESETTPVRTSSPPELFSEAAGATQVIELDRSGPMKDLGLGLDSTDKDFCIIKEISEGMVMNYNKTCPASKAIKIFDRIISVNGRPGSLTEFAKVLADLRDDTSLSIEVLHPTETSVLLKKPGVLGITLNYKNGSVGLLVKDIQDGLLDDWNKSHPDTPIKSGDLIVGVNGVRFTPMGALHQIKESSAPIMTVMRYVL